MSSADHSLCYLSATEATARFRAGTLSPVELVKALIERAEEVNPSINAFTYTFFDRALEEARKAEARYQEGTARPLEGVPLSVKDTNAVAGEITTYGSKIYEHNRTDWTHPSVERLLNAGAILFARTTMPEFGEAGNCYTPLWGVTRNPWNLEYGPGGSSAGSGAALAAGMTTLADGSDIGGSIRIPAGCCSVYGYKPPYGRNPNAYEGTFDPYMHYGPLARTVADIGLAQNVTAGFHVEDIGTVREKPEIPATFDDIAGWRVAYSVDLGYFEVDKEVEDNMRSVLATLEDLGCEVEEVDLGWTEDVFAAWEIMNGSRGAAARMVPDIEKWRPYLADYTADWLEHGIAVDMQQLLKALQTHVDMYRVLGPILETHQVFLCPTNAIPSVGAERSPLDFDIEINGKITTKTVAAAWFMTYPFNMLSQLPVMSVPSGFSSIGVPTGVQVVGPAFADLNVFHVAGALERARPREKAWPFTD